MASLINGTAYGWSQIKVNIGGVEVNGITSINYSDEREIQDNYGAGNRPVSRGYGAIATEGSITLHMAEVEALQSNATDGSLLSISEFDIVVAYLPEGGVIKTHTLKNCRFKNNGRDVSTGDMEIAVELNLAIGEIKWK